MPFYPPFNLPFFYNNYRYSYNHPKPINSNISNDSHLNYTKHEPIENKNEYKEKASESREASEAFFEIFGLKLYFDDILIMCILFFLYTEKVQDEELFICLILLLLT